MSKKAIIIGVIIILIGVFACLGFYYHDNIQNYIEEESWIYTEPYVEKKIDASVEYIAGDDLYVLRDNTLTIYNKNLEVVSTESLGTSSILYDSNKAYTCIASNDKDFIKLYKNGKEVWKIESSIEMQRVSVNPNGYVSVIFTQSGNKSGVKIYSINSEEVLNIYLASTYATDAELSNDNKQLYLAEVDLGGINAKSNVKIYDVSTYKYDTVSIAEDEIVSKVEYIDNNNVYIQTNGAIYRINYKNELSKLYSFNEKNTTYASISNLRLPVVFEKNDNILKIIKDDENRYMNFETEPQLVSSMKDKISFYFDNEIWIVNNNCRILKKYKLNTGIIDLELMNEGKILALIYSDKVELLRT